MKFDAYEHDKENNSCNFLDLTIQIKNGKIITDLSGDGGCYDEANGFVREAIAGMADDAECYGEVWDAVQKAIVEVDEAENAEPEFEPILTATGGKWNY